MQGHLRRRGKRSWAIVLNLGRDLNGQRRQKWHAVQGTKRDAQRELTRLLDSIHSGGYVEPTKLTVTQYLNRWLDSIQRKVAPKTWERYSGLVRLTLAPAIGSYPLGKLQPLHIQDCYAAALASGRIDGKGGLSPQTVLHAHRVLHEALRQAVRWRLISRNPVEAVEPPKPTRREMCALGDAEIAQLLERTSDTRLGLITLLAVTTGMRRGEVLALRWSEVDFERGTLSVCQTLEKTKAGLSFKPPKTSKSRRTIALPAITVDALKHHRAEQGKERLRLGAAYEDSGLVCARQDGKPWDPDSLSGDFRDLVRRSPLKVRFHDLRHTHATQLLREGVHPKIVSERLGHSTVSLTLDTYSHVLPGMQDAAAQGVDAALRVALSVSGGLQKVCKQPA